MHFAENVDRTWHLGKPQEVVAKWYKTELVLVSTLSVNYIQLLAFRPRGMILQPAKSRNKVPKSLLAASRLRLGHG